MGTYLLKRFNVFTGCVYIPRGKTCEVLPVCLPAIVILFNSVKNYSNKNSIIDKLKLDFAYE